MISEKVKIAKIFKAFCDEKRLLIIELLQSGEKCACDLIAKTHIAQSALSYHMKILCESGIVRSRQEGKWMHYTLNDECCTDAIRILESFRCCKNENNR
ncbi:MAG: ArsR/SmtB family transcription factor [Treponemataceae bacterium]